MCAGSRANENLNFLRGCLESPRRDKRTRQSSNPLPTLSSFKEYPIRHSLHRQDQAPKGQAPRRLLTRLPAHSWQQVLALEEENRWHYRQAWVSLAQQLRYLFQYLTKIAENHSNWTVKCLFITTQAIKLVLTKLRI